MEKITSMLSTSKEEFEQNYKAFYSGHQIGEQLYLQILAELKTTIPVSNLESFKHLCSLLDSLYAIEDKDALKYYYEKDSNPIKDTNLVILASKHNNIVILKQLFSPNCKILTHLSTTIGKNAIEPLDEDETSHNAFYYAFLSGNIEILSLLIESCPGNYFTTNERSLEQVLSKVNEEFKLKNICLEQTIETYIENKIFDLHYSAIDAKPFEDIKAELEEKISNEFQTLMKTGKDDENDDDEAPKAIELIFGNKRSLEKVKTLLKSKDMDINAYDNVGFTLLHIAAASGNLNMTKYLIELGADIHKVDVMGLKPLHAAARNGKGAIVKFYLTLGITVDTPCSSNHTMLQHACMNGHLGVVKFLISKKADVNIEDNVKSRPILMAAVQGYKDIVEVLLKNGASEVILFVFV